MEKKFKKGPHANYEIEITISSAEQEEAKATILKHFQKDFEMPGFRKGMAPLDAVEKNTKPEYIQMGIYEHLINKGLQELIKDNDELKLIGEPYDFKQEKKGDDTVMTMKLDIFPEVEVLNDEWQKEQLPEIKSAATQEEIDNALVSLKKNYADYQDTDIITHETISKIEMEFLDADGKTLDKGHNYVGEQEFTEDKRYEKEFMGKKKGDTREVVYSEKLPPVYHYKKTEGEAKKVNLLVQDVKKIVLPEMDEVMLQKLFGPESTVKNEAQLLDFITESISHQKFEAELVKVVEGLLQKVKGKHMNVAIPQTLVEQEFATRMKSLLERFGGEEKMTEYFKKLGDDQSKKFLDDIKAAAADSLEKFFILQKIVEALKLDVNREKPGHLEIEQKLYEKMGKGHDHHHHDHDHNHDHDHSEHEHDDHHHENQEHDFKEKKAPKAKKSAKK
ncbi:MAG: trigger factor [candidate division SR1 bacterium]|nr:trigger factor [candidate division SR1 bacterium]